MLKILINIFDRKHYLNISKNEEKKSRKMSFIISKIINQNFLRLVFKFIKRFSSLIKDFKAHYAPHFRHKRKPKCIQIEAINDLDHDSRFCILHRI